MISAIFFYLKRMIKVGSSFLLIILILASVVAGFSQKQLILMKRERVLLRLYPGDEITFKLKGEDRVRKTYINNIFETAVVTHRDTVAFDRIERLYFTQEKFHNRLGAYLIAGGVVLFLIDQVNYSLIQGNDFTIDNGVSKASLAGIVIGVPLVLSKKKSQKLTPAYRLFMAKKGSPFYLPPKTVGANPFLDQ